MISSKSNIKKVEVVNEKEIIEVLAVRTGVDKNLIHTLIHFYERVILHKAMTGHFVRIDNLFIIYHKEDQVHIEFTEKARRYIKKK